MTSCLKEHLPSGTSHHHKQAMGTVYFCIATNLLTGTPQEGINSSIGPPAGAHCEEVGTGFFPHSEITSPTLWAAGPAAKGNASQEIQGVVPHMSKIVISIPKVMP